MSTKVVVMGGSSGIGEAVARQFARPWRRGRHFREELRPPRGRGSETGECARRGGRRRVGRKLSAAVRNGRCVRLPGPDFERRPRRGADSVDRDRGHPLGIRGQILRSVDNASLGFALCEGLRNVRQRGDRGYGHAGTAGLAAINGAIESLARVLAAELAPVRVNCVRPGVIDTPWWDNMPKEFKSGVFAQTAQTLPVRRVGNPDDVAAAIVMAASNGFISGAVIDVSGGGTLAR